MNLIHIAILMTVYFLLILLTLWWAVRVIRQQRNADLRWHRESLLAHLRAEPASHR
jgi:nitrogen fixation-related uncharacterized protein